MLGIQTQNAVADGVERARPDEPRHDAAVARLAAIGEYLRDDGLGAANHFLGRTPREGQHEDARRIDAVQHQVGGAMRDGIGLTGTGAGQDQQRTRRTRWLSWLSSYENYTARLYGYPDRVTLHHSLLEASRICDPVRVEPDHRRQLFRACRSSAYAVDESLQ